jgi:immune inhibitor A
MHTKATVIFLLGLVLSTPALSAPANSAPANNDAQRMVDLLADFRFDQLGHPQIKSDSIRPVLASSERPHKLLVLPVRFSNTDFDRFRGDAAQDAKNRDYFQELLFAGGVANPEPATLSHYYRHQSRGLYNITGSIFPVVEMSKPQQYYGRPVQASDGSWRNDERSATGGRCPARRLRQAA